MVLSNDCLISFLLTSFWVRLSSMDFLKSANCSLMGFISSSI